MEIKTEVQEVALAVTEFQLTALEERLEMAAATASPLYCCECVLRPMCQVNAY